MSPSHTDCLQLTHFKIESRYCLRSLFAVHTCTPYLLSCLVMYNLMTSIITQLYSNVNLCQHLAACHEPPSLLSKHS